MSQTVSYEDIAAELTRRIDRTVWCSMATVDGKRRVRSRIVHPLWDGRVGWLLTERHSAKARDVDGNPWLSLTYIDSTQEQVHVDCRTEWEDRLPEKRRLWEWFKTTPPPHGYDPGLFFPKGVEDASFGCLRLIPWRIELWSLADLMSGKPPQVWKEKK
jgi:general stress protein 26